MSDSPRRQPDPAAPNNDEAAFEALPANVTPIAAARRATAIYGRVDGSDAAVVAAAEEVENARLRPQAPLLADLIIKNRDKLVDQAATTLKVLFGTAYANVPQDEMEGRIDYLIGALAKICRTGALEPEHIAEFTASVLVGPQFAGYDALSMTVEVLRVVDMSISRLIDQKLSGDTDKTDSRALLARIIHAARDVIEAGE